MPGHRQVVVTGASGFVGRALMATLSGAPDLAGLGLSRDRDGPDLATASEDDWKRALAGAESCVHLAARLPWGGDNGSRQAMPLYEATNVRGACRLFHALRVVGGRHFVLLSTVGINGVTSGPAPFRESDPPRPAGNYAVSKLRAETQLAELAAESGLALTIIRAPMVYGPGVRGRFRALVNRVRNRRALPLGKVDNHRDLIGVRNLSDLIVSVLREGVHGTFLVRDREPVSSTRLVELIAAAYGTTPRLVTAPKLLRAMATRLPVVGPQAERLFGDVRIDDGAIARACSWQPRYGVADEIGEMARADLA
jgi:nucleoside-diphosphate-sugar epimerase